MATEAEFNRFSIAVFDFEKAAQFSEEAVRNLPNSITYEALVFAAIVCYYRPFSPNERNENSSAVSKLRIQDFLPLSESERNLHKCCKRLRNKALAHSEYAHNPTRLIPESRVIASRPFSIIENAPSMQELAELSRKLANQCHHKRASYVQQIAP